MELLSMHPEIECFVLVSGDGALETLLSKLSARGKRVVRVAVQEGCVKRLNVLGEERVLYDDWVKGFRFSNNVEVVAATGKLGEAVKAIAEAGGNEEDFMWSRNGCGKKRRISRKNGMVFRPFAIWPIWRNHWAWFGLTLRKEPAQAYKPDEEIALDGAVLPSGDAWKGLLLAALIRAKSI